MEQKNNENNQGLSLKFPNFSIIAFILLLISPISLQASSVNSEALLDAAFIGNAEKVQSFLKKGAYVDSDLTLFPYRSEEVCRERVYSVIIKIVPGLN